MAESASRRSGLGAARYVGLRPGAGFLALPAAPRRALWSGLSLYDGVEPRQRGLLRAARMLIAARLGRLLPENTALRVDWDWWESWIRAVGEPLVGPVRNVAIRMPPNGRTCMLLMDGEGGPTGFVKLLAAPPSHFAAAVRDRLATAPLSSARIPRTWAEGQHDGVQYAVFEPITPGPHRRPPYDPNRIAAIVDEWHGRVSSLARPPDVPDHYVVSHTGFTPRNVRVAGKNEWWLYDWDNVTWAPRMAPELRYWCADLAYRWRVSRRRAPGKIYALLRRRATPAEIHEAAIWSGSLPTYRAMEEVLRAEVGDLAARAS